MKLSCHGVANLVKNPMLGGNEHCLKGDDFTLPPVIHSQSLPSAVMDDILPDD